MIVGIALDGSLHAKRAFDSYINDLHKEGNEVVLFHVIHVAVSVNLSEMAAVSKHCETAFNEATALQQKYEEKLGELQISGKWINIQDDKKIGAAIVHAVEEHQVEMVVIGARGSGVLRRTFLGSVSDYVLHHSKVPVIVCRPEAHQGHHSVHS